ncbi:SOS response-associated peptidase [Legionella taurinensis]|nr:SOS response-associated peptidase [Legionella taurinensis]
MTTDANHFMKPVHHRMPVILMKKSKRSGLITRNVIKANYWN